MQDTQTPSQFQRPGGTTRVAAPDESKGGLFSNILAIVGFIILIVVVIWGLVNLAGISRSWLSYFFEKSESAIEVSAPKSATSGEAFMVSWKYNPPVAGTYAFLHQCQNGLQIQTPSPIGGMNTIPCGAAFTLPGENNEVSLTPQMSGSKTLDVPLTIIFMPSATGTRAQGSANMAIAPVSNSAPTESVTLPTQATPAPQKTFTPASKTNTSPADLSVVITSASIDASGQAVVTFDISNVGGSTSSTYSFSATLPSYEQSTYSSPVQSALPPGGHILNTLRFSAPFPGTFSVTITGTDSNPANNSASQILTASYGSYNYNSDYSTQYSSAYYSQTYPAHQYPYVQYSPYSPFSPYTY